VIRYIVKRILASIPLLFGLLSATFVVIHLAPGDPTTLYLQSDTDPQYAERLRHAYGLDAPLPVQYVRWMESVVTGDFGFSFGKHAPVAEILADAVPRTLLLTVAALVFNFAVGVALGVFSALRRGTRLDRFVNIASLFVYSMPEFWLGLMLILWLALALPIFPVSGLQSPLADDLPFLRHAWDVAQHLVLPVFVLGIASAAATARYMRGSLLDVVHQEYVRTARAKGLTEFTVIGKHALRNALLPIVTLFGLSLPFLLGGAVIVETVFGIPGMGKLTVDAIFTRDYPVIIATTLVSGVMVVLGNLLSDVLYAVVDPRIRVR
jgi:peptide/nickel transport system permease protein